MLNRIALLGALTLPLLAQQPCQPQSKVQKAAAWLNRARTGTAVSPAPAPCPASASAPGSIDTTPGATIDTGTLSGPAFLSGGPGSGAAGYIKFTRGLLQWMWNPNKNQQLPILRIDFGGGYAGQTEQELRLEGMKAGAYYFSGFLAPGTGQVINVSLTKEASGQYTLRSAGLKLPTDLTDLSGRAFEQEAPAPKPSYTFQPYPKSIEDALHKAEQQQTGAGLKANAHGGTLSVTTNGDTVTLALVQNPDDVRNLWHAQNDPAKAFLIDSFNGNTTVTPLIRQGDGSFLSEDGKRLTVFNGVASVK